MEKFLSKPFYHPSEVLRSACGQIINVWFIASDWMDFFSHPRVILICLMYIFAELVPADALGRDYESSSSGFLLFRFGGNTI